MNNKKTLKADSWQRYLQLGLELSLYIIIFTFLGYYLDIKFETKPYLTFTGVFLGMFGVFYSIWKKFLR
ncbi:MAG: AtpZ/AtpI family protein [Elusimicrobia bacterium]|nr:AtpZ/AtpI family protein [Elusimicrobiota bacterium]